MQKVDQKPKEIIDPTQPTLSDLASILASRKLFAEHIESTMLRDIVQGTVIRFSIQNGKYIIGFVEDLVQVAPVAGQEQKYPIAFQRKVGYDKATQKNIVKNETVSTSKELLVRMGNHGLHEKARRVKISHISNSPISEKEFLQLKLNFNHQLPIKKDQIP
jgi:hypothetical protein